MGERYGISSRAIIGNFYQTLEQNFASSWPGRVGMGPFASDQGSETYKWLGMSPAMREWIGGREAKGLRSNGITIENKVYEATLDISVDDLRRDKTGQIMVRVGEMADRANAHWAKLLSELLIHGDTTNRGLAYDGQYFFDTDHSEGDSGSLSNAITASDYGVLNVSTAAEPTPAELAQVILAMVQHQYSYLDDQGEPLNEGAREFVLMVPINMWAAAEQVTGQAILNTGSGTIDNPIRSNVFRIEAVANPRLDWTTELALLRTDGRVKPFILQEEQPLKASMIGEGSELEFRERTWQFGIEAIRNVGYGYWQHATKATLS